VRYNNQRDYHNYHNLDDCQFRHHDNQYHIDRNDKHYHDRHDNDSHSGSGETLGCGAP
jgi:hypothetical protein